jgi:hypothetical protein
MAGSSGVFEQNVFLEPIPKALLLIWLETYEIVSPEEFATYRLPRAGTSCQFQVKQIAFCACMSVSGLLLRAVDFAHSVSSVREQSSSCY